MKKMDFFLIFAFFCIADYFRGKVFFYNFFTDDKSETILLNTTPLRKEKDRYIKRGGKEKEGKIQ